MINGVPIKNSENRPNMTKTVYSESPEEYMFRVISGSVIALSLFTIPSVIAYYEGNKKPLEYIFLFIVFVCFMCIFIGLKGLTKKMFEKLLMNSDEKEFAKLTRDLNRDKYIALKTYFKATGTSVESSNNFLKSCRGVAFLEAYKKSPLIDNIEISKLILDVEREEQIISCAVDILKAY
jgi:hypothetical protein